jgi:hypothetical protein
VEDGGGCVMEEVEEEVKSKRCRERYWRMCIGGGRGSLLHDREVKSQCIYNL